MLFDDELPMVNFCSIITNCAKGEQLIECEYDNDFYNLSYYQISNSIITCNNRDTEIHDGYITFSTPKTKSTRHIFGDDNKITILFYAIGCEDTNFAAIYPDNTKEYEKLFCELLKCYSSANVGNHYKCNELLYKILYKLCSEQDIKKNYPHHNIAHKAARYLDGNISNPNFSVEELANELNISTSYLRIVFKDEYGMSPKEYQIKARMQLAKAILYNSYCPISVVAAICGFDNEKYFSTMFKKYYGTSPMQYNKNSTRKIMK